MTCHYCGGIATSHIDAVQNYRPLQQGLKDGIAVATDDQVRGQQSSNSNKVQSLNRKLEHLQCRPRTLMQPSPRLASLVAQEKSEILNDFLFLGNAAASRERNVEIMEYTHIINCSVELPCYWDFDDEVNSWLKNNVREGPDGKEIGDDRAILKLRRLKKLGVKVRMDRI